MLSSVPFIQQEEFLVICDRKVYIFPNAPIEESLICPDCKTPLSEHEREDSFEVPMNTAYVMREDQFKSRHEANFVEVRH